MNMTEKESVGQEVAHESKKQEVILLLKKHNIPFERWGTGTAKTLNHLVEEIMEGETLLEENESGELVRTVSIIYINVYYSDTKTGGRKKLVEDRQVFADGRERKRTYLAGSVAEKLKANEAPSADTVKRAIQEELDIAYSGSVTETGQTEETQDSPSYPGLKMKAKNYFFEIELSDEAYRPEGYVEHQKDKDTHFKWISE